MSKNFECIFAFREAKCLRVFWREKMVICSNTILSNEKSTPTCQFLVAIHPNIEVLLSFCPKKTHVHTLNNSSALRDCL